MASVKVIETQMEKVVLVPVKRYILELNEDEAQVVSLLTGLVMGESATRAIASGIYVAFKDCVKRPRGKVTVGGERYLAEGAVGFMKL